MSNTISFRRRRLSRSFGRAITLTAFFAAGSAHAARLLELATPEGDVLQVPWALSADGTSVVGRCVGPNVVGGSCRWREGAGIRSIGQLEPGPFVASTATAVSADGSVVVGYADTTAGLQAFRWTESGGIAPLGSLGEPVRSTQAFGVSGDGAVVSGFAVTTTGWRVFRWTASEGLVVLPGGPFDIAFGVSGDGTTLVGSTNGHGATLPPGPFRWTQSEGFVSLGQTAPGMPGIALAATADATVIVGGVGAGVIGPAFRWTAATGPVALPQPAGSFQTVALAVSNDGAIVAGGDQQSGVGWIWDADHGSRRLVEVLQNEHGIDFQALGVTLGNVRGLSADGTRLVTFGASFGSERGILIDLAAPSPGPACGIGPELAPAIALLALRRRSRP